MSADPKVSVVVATYNRASYLPATIESILQQRFQDFELIVVDDGSTDGTQDALRPYGNRLRYVNQRNRGPSAARNAGVKLARGPWLAIQDSDDICAPNYLESLHRFAAAHSDCGMVFANGGYLSGEAHHRETIIPASKSRRLAEQGVKLDDLFDKSIVRLQAALISKKCYDAVGGHDESLRISMDLDLAFRLYARYPMAYLDEVVFFYRKHEGNISANQELRLLENIHVIEKMVHEFPKAERLLGRKKIARRLAYRYYRLAKGRWRAGRKESAREALQKALELNPLALKYRYYQMQWM